MVKELEWIEEAQLAVSAILFKSLSLSLHFGRDAFEGGWLLLASATFAGTPLFDGENEDLGAFQIRRKSFEFWWTRGDSNARIW